MSTECFVAAWGLIFSTFLIKGGAVTYVTREVLEGDVEFSCNLTYDPSENFRWIINRGTSSLGILVRPAGSPPEDAYRLNSPFQNRTDISLSGADGTNLTIESVRRTDEAIGEDYYECQQRMGDKDTVRHQLIVQYPPDPPTNLTLTTTSAGLKAICVAGKSKTGSQMICLEYQQHEASKWNKEEPCQPAIRDGRTVQFEVSGLQSMQSYNVCCTASDAYGATATCQNTGPVPMTTGSSPLTPGGTVAIVICVCLVIAFFICVYCCRKHGKEGHVCHKIPCPCPFGKRGNSGNEHDGRENIQMNADADNEATGASSKRMERKYSLNCCNCCSTIDSYRPARQDIPEEEDRTVRREENSTPNPSAPVVTAAIPGSVTQQEVTMETWVGIFKILEGTRLEQMHTTLARELGLSNNDILQIDHDLQARGSDKLHQILWKWKNSSRHPSPDILMRALRNIGCDALADKVQDFVDRRGSSGPTAPNLQPGTGRSDNLQAPVQSHDGQLLHSTLHRLHSV